jgi:hypothetical protein
MIRVLRQRWFDRPLQTRIPFRYGIATLTECQHAWLELEAEIDGERVTGWAADHLPPKWFTKDPQRALDAEVEDMREVLRAASRHAASARGSVAEIYEAMDARQREWARARGHPPLLAHFGVSLVERALLDAHCRRHRITLAAALRDPRVGFAPARLHPELAGTTVAEGLPAAPLSRAWARHTVGLGDPLEDGDVGPGEDPGDGLPVSLVAVIRRYRQTHFKIKVAATAPDPVARLARTVAIIGRETGGEFTATLDGNETFPDIASLRTFWDEARREPALAPLWSRLLFLEQPIARSHALAEEVGDAMRDWPERPPLLIDESGAEPADTRRALELGYAGVSHKNCKGVLHGVANACLLARRRREQPSGSWMMSAEDLSNIGPISLPQDLAVQAALGNASIERNSHHYFAGLSGWPEATRAYARATFADLYADTPAGWPTLAVCDGRIALDTCNAAAFGGPWPVMPPERAPWFEV